MNFELTEEQKLVQKTARDFSRTELLPGAVDRIKLVQAAGKAPLTYR